MDCSLPWILLILVNTSSVSEPSSNTHSDETSPKFLAHSNGHNYNLEETDACPATSLLQWLDAGRNDEISKRIPSFPSKLSVGDNYVGEDPRKGFFVITTIFNPASFKSRYELYHQFSRHMEETGAQLITVECIFPHLNQSEFLVTHSNNPFHIQIKSKSIYWMKENLINIAAGLLPAHARWVSWLDADIHFHDKDWVDLTIQQLKNYTVVQVFEKCKFLGPNGSEVLRIDFSFGYSVVHGKIIDQARHDEWYPHPGFGWAMSITSFRAMGGLPLSDILGSSDVHFAYSVINKVSRNLESKLRGGHPFAKNILEESKKIFGKLAAVSQDGSVVVGYVPLTISHHWHGSRENRQYHSRLNIFINHQFDFRRDMKAGSDGLLEFMPTKWKMQEDVISYFQRRNEDDTKVHAKQDGNCTTLPIS